MTLQVFANDASSLLASGIAPSDVTVTVTAGEGALFPAVAAGQACRCVLEDTSGNIEIVSVTGRTTDTMTIVRAQENTTALSFASGSRFENRPTAGMAALWLQKNGGDTLSGTTNLTGIIHSTGSIQGGEIAGAAIRGSPGETDNQVLVPTDGSAPTAGGSAILTVANVAAELEGTGTGLVITGMVLFWTGASNAIPTGYTLCDGTDGTPDLRDQFILCGGGSLPPTGGSSSTVTGSSGIGALTVAGHSLTTNEMPSHSHVIKAGLDTLNGAGPGFALTGFPGGAHFPGPHGEDDNGHSELTGTGDPHTHGISGSSAHTHTYSLPPYRALFAIMKL